MDINKDFDRTGNTPDTLLIVDDDAMNRAILREIFQASYQIEEAANGQEGLERLLECRERICAVLLDVVMPVMNGLELLQEIKKREELAPIPVFLITADAAGDTLRRAYELGVMDVIGKPVTPYVVRRRVDSVVELFLSRKKMSDLVEFQKQELIDREMEILNLNKGMVEALATAIEFRSGESGEHVRRISHITRYMLGKTPLGAGIPKEMLEHITLAAVMHDVGKIAISDAILNKPGRLTAEEYEIMKQHTVLGAALLEKIPQLRNHKVYKYACDIARHHHERWDGKGYPDGLKGEEISVWSQVVALADVYDALVSERVYKKAFDCDTAVRMIRNGECGVFNPEMLEYFEEAEKELRIFYS